MILPPAELRGVTPRNQRGRAAYARRSGWIDRCAAGPGCQCRPAQRLRQAESRYRQPGVVAQPLCGDATLGGFSKLRCS